MLIPSISEAYSDLAFPFTRSRSGCAGVIAGSRGQKGLAGEVRALAGLTSTRPCSGRDVPGHGVGTPPAPRELRRADLNRVV